jgi:hypothetical protein
VDGGDTGIKITNPTSNSASTASIGFEITTSTYEHAGILATRTDAGELHFRTAGGTTQMTVDSSGNVGIGTASPGAKLDVEGAVKVAGGLAAWPSAYGLYIDEGAAAGKARIIASGNGTIDGTLSIGVHTGDGLAGGNTEVIFIDSSGRVGIGYPSPIYKLDVDGTFRVSGTSQFDDTASFDTINTENNVNLGDGTGSPELAINSANNGDSSILFQENSVTKWTLKNDGDDSDALKLTSPGSASMQFNQNGFINLEDRLGISGNISMTGRVAVGAGGTSAVSPVNVDVTSKTMVILTPTSGNNYYSFTGKRDGQVLFIRNSAASDFADIDDGAIYMNPSVSEVNAVAIWDDTGSQYIGLDGPGLGA